MIDYEVTTERQNFGNLQVHIFRLANTYRSLVRTNEHINARGTCSDEFRCIYNHHENMQCMHVHTYTNHVAICSFTIVYYTSILKAVLQQSSINMHSEPWKTMEIFLIYWITVYRDCFVHRLRLKGWQILRMDNFTLQLILSGMSLSRSLLCLHLGEQNGFYIFFLY